MSTSDHETPRGNAVVEAAAAVAELFTLDELTVEEVEQGLSTLRDVAREAILDIADAVGHRDFASASLDTIVEATLALRR